VQRWLPPQRAARRGARQHHPTTTNRLGRPSGTAPNIRKPRMWPVLFRCSARWPLPFPSSRPAAALQLATQPPSPMRPWPSWTSYLPPTFRVASPHPLHRRLARMPEVLSPVPPVPAGAATWAGRAPGVGWASRGGVRGGCVSVRVNSGRIVAESWQNSGRQMAKRAKTSDAEKEGEQAEEEKRTGRETSRLPGGASDGRPQRTAAMLRAARGPSTGGWPCAAASAALAALHR